LREIDERNSPLSQPIISSVVIGAVVVAIETLERALTFAAGRQR
jgi:hypothetical protein